MKKIICVLLCQLALLSVLGIVSAEEFSLRNGIHLGDTAEKVLELENIPLKKRQYDTSKFYGGALYEGTGKIVNVDDSKLKYFFDKDDKLQEMTYDLLTGMEDGPWGFANYEDEYSGAAEPPVRCGLSHLSGAC